MKKAVYLVGSLCLVLLLSFFIGKSGAAGGFGDVKKSDWFYSGVRYVTKNGILGGVTGTTFQPEGAVDRQTFITALYKYSVLKGCDVSIGLETNILSYEDAFDIKEGSFEAFQWACGSGLYPETEATSLGVNEIISREEAVIFLYDYAVLYGVDPDAGKDTNILSYTDIADINREEAYGAFQWACGAGILAGATPSALDPAGNMTRAQLADVLLRLSKKG